MFSVFLDKIELNGKHGVAEEERRIGNRFLIDIRLVVNGNADHTDHLHDTVDYAQVCEGVWNVSESRSFHTVEALAGSIADAILELDDKIVEAWVRVAKIHPPVGMIVRSAGAEVTRKRG